MSFRGLDFAAVHLPLSSGLNLKPDTRALQPPSLLIAKNIQFDEDGGIQTRKPYGDPLTDIFGGGTIADARRIVAFGDELLMFTKDTLYSWDAQLEQWISKGTHLAVKVDEEPKFITTGDQTQCDRAELNGTVFYAWCDADGAYVAAVDKETGSVRMAPRNFNGGNANARPRLVALTSIVLFVYHNESTPRLECRALSPTDPNAGLDAAATAVTVGNHPAYADACYDVCQVIGSDSAVFASRRNPDTSYLVGTIDSALTVTRSPKARVCDGPIAVSCTPDGASVQVARADGFNISGDLITISSLADVYTGTVISTLGAGNWQQITAAHRSVQDSGEYRCYVFWGYSPSGSNVDVGYNWVDTANAHGTEASLTRCVGIASRAFDYDGSVYLWTVFAAELGLFGSTTLFGGALQNTYYLFRDDTTYHATAAQNVAGGFSYHTGHLPGVQLTDGTTGFSWCGGERRIIPVGTTRVRQYADLGPRDITFTFDSNAARRCIQFGRTLIVSGGEVLQYDGVKLTELGFHVLEYFTTMTDSGTGAVEAGLHAVKTSWNWTNAKGEIDRSSSLGAGTVTIGAPPGGVIIVDWFPLYITKKLGVTANSGTFGFPAAEVWRTEVDPVADSPFFLVTSKDPSVLTGANCYIANDPTSTTSLPSFTDELSDADASKKEQFPENGAVTPGYRPPPATVISANQDRLFLAGVAGDPHRVWYSKLRSEGQVAAFNGDLTIPIPEQGGDITALAFNAETLIVFREKAIYALPGEGYSNTGQGTNYGPARILATDVGAMNAESVAVTPVGLFFKSLKGWYLLTSAFQLTYIGDKVADYDDEEIVAVHVLEHQHQIRCVSGSRTLMFDYHAGEWAEWTQTGVHAAMYGGTHYVLGTDGPVAQQDDYAAALYGLDVELAWYKPAGLLGEMVVDQIQILGELRSDCRLQIQLARDYQQTYFQDKTSEAFAGTAGDPLQLKVGPSIRAMKAIKVRITARRSTLDENGDPETAEGESLKLTGVSLEIGLERGLHRRLAEAQRI